MDERSSSASPESPPADRGRATRRGCFVFLSVIALGLLVGTILLAVRVAEFRRLLDEDPLAAAEEMAGRNPGIEVIGRDESAGTLTLRDRKSGDVQTVSIAELLGRRPAGVVPAWLPALPEAVEVDPDAEASMGGARRTLHYRTSQSVGAFLEEYGGRLQDRGFELRSVGNLGAAGMLCAREPDTGRAVDVTVGNDGGWTRIVLQLTEAPAGP